MTIFVLAFLLWLQSIKSFHLFNVQTYR